MLQIIFSLILIFLGPEIYPDSQGYLEFSELRAPLYCWFTYLLTWGSFWPIIIAQLVMAFFSIRCLIKTLRQYFAISLILDVIICGVLYVPYLWNSHIGNAILTEGLCYPLFIYFVAFLLKGVFENQVSYLAAAAGFTALLVLTRHQFLFLYPFVVIFPLYLLKNNVLRIKHIGLFLLSFFCFLGVENAYNYFKFDNTQRAGFLGYEMIVGSLFVSKDSDALLFHDEKRVIFETVFLELRSKGLTYDLATRRDIKPYFIYADNYNIIRHKITKNAYAKIKLPEPILYKFVTEMAIKLILENKITYTKLYISNIIFNLGGYYFSIIVLICFMMCTYLTYRTRDKISIYGFLIMGLTLGNYMLVALVEPVMRRYSIYTDTLLVVYFLMLIQTYFTRALHDFGRYPRIQ